jgi:hypothetical protein
MSSRPDQGISSFLASCRYSKVVSCPECSADWSSYQWPPALSHRCWSPASSRVAPHPIPRDQQERGIGDKVEQVAELAMSIITNPTVQLGLDLQYPILGPQQGQLRIARVHRRHPSWHSSIRPARLAGPLSPCVRLSRTRRRVVTPANYREAFARTGHPSAATPAQSPSWTDPGTRRTPVGSHVHQQSISQGGAQLYPGSIATATPQAFTVASSPPEPNGFGVRPLDTLRA